MIRERAPGPGGAGGGAGRTLAHKVAKPAWSLSGVG